MKRHTPEVNIQSKNKKPKKNIKHSKESNQESSAHSSWTLEEDHFLQSEVEKASVSNWHKICKMMNKTFKNKKRAIDECKQRYCLLTENASTSAWSQNEDFMLLYFVHFLGMNWEIICSMFPNRKAFELKRRFISILTSIIKKAKTPEMTIATPLEIFKTLFCITLMLDKTSKKSIEINEIQKLFKVSDEKFMDLLKTVSSQIGIPQVNWTSANLKQTVDKMIEQLKNAFLSFDAHNLNFNEIMHPPKENQDEQQPNNMNPEFMLPQFPFGYMPFMFAFPCVLMPYPYPY